VQGKRTKGEKEAVGKGKPPADSTGRSLSRFRDGQSRKEAALGQCADTSSTACWREGRRG
jgi:hypothetical protein